MTTDNTQELDEMLQPIRNYADIVEIDVAKERLLDWHNKQTLELLDRLRLDAVYGEYDKSEDDSEQGEVVPVMAIEAERNKLKESSNEA